MDVAVLGAGSPGRAIAQVCVLAGHAVSLHDDDATAAMDGIDAIEQRLDAAVAAGEYDDAVRAAAVDRLEATTGLDAAVADADIVIDTARTDAGTLQETLAAVEGMAGRETLMAPTATGISVTAAAAGLRHPDRAVGLRSGEPLERPLVEVVVADQTAGDARDRAVSFVKGLDRSPVVVRDTPGGASVRAELALEAEAMRLVEEGVAGVGAVDDALALGYDHPVGPLERADRAGLDARMEALEYLQAELGARFEPPDVLRDRVASGATGTRTGEGFYRWEDGDPTEPALPDPDIPDRAHGPDDPTG